MFSTLLLFLLCRVVQSTTNCNDELVCNNTVFSGESYLYGNGYKSLFRSPTNYTSTTRECGGALSCQHTPYIDTKNLNCHGIFSCSNSEYIKAHPYPGSLQIHGSHSMTYTNVSCDSKIWCYADRSCAYSTISSSSQCQVWANAAFSLFETTMTVLSGTFSGFFYGYYSAYQSTIHCKSGAVCTIMCNYNACGGLSLICESGSTCQVNTQTQTTLYPTNITVLTTENIVNSTAIITSNEAACSSQTTTKTFDTYREQNQGNMVYTADEGPICCRATYSCLNSYISYTSNVGSIICSGSQSCYGFEAVTNNFAIECSGRYACRTASITGNTNLYCFGHHGCSDANITAVKNIYCSGSYACFNNRIISSGQNLNISFTTYKAGWRATIICQQNDYCTILCQAYLSCEDVQLICDGTCSVQCDQDTHCPRQPTLSPTQTPTTFILNTTVPTKTPSLNPSGVPTDIPTTNIPTTNSPTLNPSSVPTNIPTTGIPTTNTNSPTTSAPTTLNPSDVPTLKPTTGPSLNPSGVPTTIPTLEPTFYPTLEPSIRKTDYPTRSPTTIPTITPTVTNTINSIAHITTYEITVEFDENANKEAVKTTILHVVQIAYPESNVINVNILDNKVIVELSIASKTDLEVDQIEEKISDELQLFDDEQHIKSVSVEQMDDKQEEDNKSNSKSFIQSFWWIFVVLLIIVLFIVLFIYCFYRQRKLKLQLDTTNVSGKTNEFVEIKNASPRVQQIQREKENEGNDSDKSTDEMYDTQPTKGGDNDSDKSTEEMYDAQKPTKGNDSDHSQENSEQLYIETVTNK